jgi:short-subunit dehydrogenase
MIEHKDGHILGIASAAAKSASPFSAAYTASKFGVNGFYKYNYYKLS